MRKRLNRTATYLAYHVVVAMGLLLLPLAVALQRTVGVGVPLHRLLEPLRRSVEAE